MNWRRYLTWSPHQRQRRAIVKTLCYRLFMVLITISVAWFVTGDGLAAVSIGLVTNVLKTGTYYVYERAWDHIDWGMAEEPTRSPAPPSDD